MKERGRDDLESRHTAVVYLPQASRRLFHTAPLFFTGRHGSMKENGVKVEETCELETNVQAYRNVLGITKYPKPDFNDKFICFEHPLHPNHHHKTSPVSIIRLLPASHICFEYPLSLNLWRAVFCCSIT